MAVGARGNRDGIGAEVSFTPLGGKAVMSPVVGGSSHLSQRALERIFGLRRRLSGRLLSSARFADLDP